MLRQINRTFEKMMPVFTPLSVILGIIFSAYLRDLTFLVTWLFAFMTFEGSLSMNFRSFRGAILHPIPVIILLGFLHIFMPLYAWGIGSLAFNGDTLTITGFVLGMVIPTGVTSFIWVSMYKGNAALALTVILIDSLLSPLIVPPILSLIMGQSVELDVLRMMKGLLYMVVLPSIAGMLLNEFTKGRVKDVWKPRLAPFSKIFLWSVVMLNGAAVAPYLREIHIKLLFIIFTVFFITVSGFTFALLLGKLIKNDRENVVTFTYVGGMRNISAGAAIAISFFPAAVVVPVVVGMLFQQVISSFYGKFLDNHFKRKYIKKTSRISV